MPLLNDGVVDHKIVEVSGRRNQRADRAEQHRQDQRPNDRKRPEKRCDAMRTGEECN
jgi:hypothetical protein